MNESSREINIWYLFHSGFAVRTPNRLLIFDYYSQSAPGALEGLGCGEINPEEIKDLDVIVFSSHKHPDHFSRTIFDWRGHIKSLHYVLSREIWVDHDIENVLRVKPGHTYELEGLGITVLKSTDTGSAFLVEDGVLTMFHAGDLNWWHWEGEPNAYNRSMAEKYRKQIDLLKGKSIDLAFIPLDPRLGEHYLLGLDYFMRTVGCQMAFPMHFGEDYSVFKHFKRDLRAEDYRSKVVEISYRGQQFTYVAEQV